MLNQVSWTTYFEIIIFLTAIYYSFVLFRYYADDLRHLVKPRQAQTSTSQTPEVLRYQHPETIASPMAEAPTNHIHYEQTPPSGETGELITQLKQVIHSAADKPFAPAVLIPQIKKLFRDNSPLQQSPIREAINELVVQECEKTGTALLSEDEVDQWWTD